MHIISDVIRENTIITTFTITSQDTVPFAWVAGQFLRISVLFDEGWSEEHTFTISSAPEEGVMRITVKTAGPFTTRLQTVKPLTEVRIRGPYGSFCKGIEKIPVITMIAGGIGITPFLSVLRHLDRAGAKNRIVLFWANNQMEDVIRREELEQLMDTLDLRIVHVLRVEGECLKANSTKENQFFASGLLSAEIFTKYSDIGASDIYMCGPPKMNEFALDIIKTLGVDSAKIHTELILPPKR